MSGRPLLSVRLAPGGSADLALVLTHGFTSGWFIIGESPLLHPAAIMRLPAVRLE